MADLNRIPGVDGLIARTERRVRDIALWKAFWPVIALTSVYLIAALLGVFEGAPSRVAAFAALLFFAGTIIALLRGVRRFRAPQRQEAISELDKQSDLRPLSSLTDRPAIPEKQGVELWTAHEERLTDAARRMRARGPGRAVVVFYDRLNLGYSLKRYAVGFRPRKVLSGGGVSGQDHQGKRTKPDNSTE